MNERKDLELLTEIKGSQKFFYDDVTRRFKDNDRDINNAEKRIRGLENEVVHREGVCDLCKQTIDGLKDSVDGLKESVKTLKSVKHVTKKYVDDEVQRATTENRRAIKIWVAIGGTVVGVICFVGGLLLG